MNGDPTALTTAQLAVPAPAVPQEAAAAASPLTALGLSDLYKLGKALTPTGFLPAAIKTPEQALAVMLKGQELRIPPMQALSTIVVINGKPTASAELMLALIYRDQGDGAVVFTEASPTAATISYKRRGWRDRQTFSFTLQDARTAGLSGGNWAKYPAAMLRARCISAVARMAYPDVIGGMYTAEELGATVDVETGEILVPPPTKAMGTADAARQRMDAEVARPVRPLGERQAAFESLPAEEQEALRAKDVARRAAEREPDALEERLAEPEDDGAPHIADTEAAARAIETTPTARPDGAVLQGAPATDKQLQTIARMARAAGKAVETAGLTRKEASDIITGLVDGMSAGR